MTGTVLVKVNYFEDKVQLQKFFESENTAAVEELCKDAGYVWAWQLLNLGVEELPIVPKGLPFEGEDVDRFLNSYLVNKLYKREEEEYYLTTSKAFEEAKKSTHFMGILETSYTEDYNILIGEGLQSLLPIEYID